MTWEEAEALAQFNHIQQKEVHQTFNFLLS